MQVGLKTKKMSKYCHLQLWIGCPINIYTEEVLTVICMFDLVVYQYLYIWLYLSIFIQKKYFFFLFFLFFCFNLSSSVWPCWFALYQWRAEEVWLIRYMILLQHMLVLLWHHCYRLLGTKRQHQQSCFCHFQLSLFHKQEEKFSDKLLWTGVYFSLHSYNTAQDASLVHFPFVLRWPWVVDWTLKSNY